MKDHLIGRGKHRDLKGIMRQFSHNKRGHEANARRWPTRSRMFHFMGAILLGMFFLKTGPGFALAEVRDLQKRETVLERKVSVEKELALEIPQVPRWCDRLDLKKGRVNIGDCELYVEEEGKGTPVVLLHGGPGGTHHGFHPEFSRARSFARLIYYDQRGCGLSDYKKGPGYTLAQAVDDLENLRLALNIEKWVVLGWSYGGLLGQHYALKYPGSVLGLILVAADAGIPSTKTEETRQQDYISPEEKKRLAEVSLAIFKMARERGWSQEKMMELLVYNRQLNGDWKRQHYYKPMPDQFAMAALYEWKQDVGFNAVMSRDKNKSSLKGAFENCSVPTLILEAKWDLTWTPEKIGIIHRNHPGSRLVVLEHAGHILFRDEPEKFFAELKSFIEGLPRARAERRREAHS
jgi:proline iminopeptidase